MEHTVLSGAPGYYSAFAYWLGALLFIMVSPRKQKGVRLAVVLLFFGVCIVGFSVLTDTRLPIYFLPCLLSVLAMTFLMIFICVRGSLMNVAYLCIRAFVLGEFFAALEG